MALPKNKLAISTSCLGLHSSHKLDDKIRAAARHSFSGIEIVFGDLERYSNAHNIPLAKGAEEMQKLCREFKLHILSLCPLENFEGTKTLLKNRLQVANQWIDIARILGTTHIQVPAQYGQDVSTDEETIVSELQQLADLASATEPVITIAYEPMSWSTCYSTWESALHLAEAVDRPNFGICIDTFHIASKLWGDPALESGVKPNAEGELADSLNRFVEQFPLDKLFYVQLSDGERFDPLYSKAHPWYLEGEAPEFTWSKHARPFPLETDLGGYMPVAEMVQAFVVEKGFKGWVSMETFDRRMREKEFEVEEGAIRAERSVEKLRKALQTGETNL